MVGRLHPLLLASALALGACAKPSGDPEAPGCTGCDPAPVVLPESDNPLDAALAPALREAGVAPIPAGTTEICRRITADLTGRFPSALEVERDCARKSLDEIARALQARPEYLETSRSFWRDRFETTDVVTDWRYLRELYGFVDALHRGELAYDDFAVEVLGHPGFQLTVFSPDERADKAFRVFLGRAPTAAERAGTAPLFRPWIPEDQQDPDLPYLRRIGARVLPALCAPLTTCSTDLLGGGAVVFPEGAPFGFLAWEDLDEDAREALREPGRIFARQPVFYEAAADAILDRFLDWDEGERDPRTPGYVVPAVRRALAAFLKETGDWPAAERLVLTSFMYASTNARVPGDGDDVPVFARGPVKAASAEVWLRTALTLTPGVTTCDPRYSDGFPYFLVLQAMDQGVVDQATAEEGIRTLAALRDDGMGTFVEDGVLRPDYRFTFLARLVGGCPGFEAKRQKPVGLAYAFLQEAVAELICRPDIAVEAAPAGELNLGSILDLQMRKLYGRAPTQEEVDAFVEAWRGCDDEDCGPYANVSSVCVALLGSAEMLFY